MSALLIAACVVGYILIGALVFAVISAFEADERGKVDFSQHLWPYWGIAWPLIVPLAAVLAIALGVGIGGSLLVACLFVGALRLVRVQEVAFSGNTYVVKELTPLSVFRHWYNL
jgi:hypothetical protein